MWIVSKGKWFTSCVKGWTWWGPTWTSRAIVTMPVWPSRRHPLAKCQNTRWGTCTWSIWKGPRKSSRNSSKPSPSHRSTPLSSNSSRCRCSSSSSRCRWCSKWWWCRGETLRWSSRWWCSSRWWLSSRTKLTTTINSNPLPLSPKSRNKPKSTNSNTSTSSSRPQPLLITSLLIYLDRNLKIKSTLIK